MAALAGKLEMKPPALQGYLSGRRNPGVELLRKLAALGFDSRSELCSPNGELANTCTPPVSIPPLAFPAAQALLGLPLETFAPQLEATPHQVKGWAEGKAFPTIRQLALLFNLVTVAGVAACRDRQGSAVSQPASSDAKGTKAA